MYTFMHSLIPQIRKVNSFAGDSEYENFRNSILRVGKLNLTLRPSYKQIFNFRQYLLRFQNRGLNGISRDHFQVTTFLELGKN